LKVSGATIFFLLVCDVDVFARLFTNDFSR